MIKNNEIINLIFMLAIILLVLWNIILSISFTRLKGKYKKMMRGSSNKNLEQMIADYMASIESTIDRVQLLNEEVIHLKEQTDRCVQKLSITRYNAFSDTGSDLSYSIALLDNYNNGVIITSIYGRNESVTYAKPIENGSSKYPLSVEEEMVLNRCLKSKR
ncbi:Protein of unknown function [Lutispora thermophila DSM 19022]|uniref:DUF4446 domain-containing protein n=1 Tax=Lutispora thermophila DSM 19022 TaxID=1122184 RepID=A0A1M6HYP6_9FIRM|nr:Protein of unknown function [Lutispora thermophila DSM 19022]